MKLTFSALALAALLFGAVSLHADDWMTIDGKSYPGVKVIKIEPDAVTILYRDGGALIPLAKLTDDLQKKFNYDAAIAKAAADARDKADFENARLLREEADQAYAHKQAELEAESSGSDSDDSGGGYSSAASSQTHYSISSLVNVNHRLRDDVPWDSTHFSVSSAVPPGPISYGAPGVMHYSIVNVFGMGDPLAQ
jgi:hypothetical protein